MMAAVNKPWQKLMRMAIRILLHNLFNNTEYIQLAICNVIPSRAGVNCKRERE